MEKVNGFFLLFELLKNKKKYINGPACAVIENESVIFSYINWQK